MGFCHISHFPKWLGKVVAWFLLSTHFFRLRNCDFENILNFDLSNILLIFLPMFNQIGSNMAIFSIVYSLKTMQEKGDQKKNHQKILYQHKYHVVYNFYGQIVFSIYHFPTNMLLIACSYQQPILKLRVLNCFHDFFFFYNLFLKKVVYWLLC